MKKLLFLIIAVIFLSGCSSKEQLYPVDTIHYDLKISNHYQENIVFTFSKNAYEKAMDNVNVDYDSLEYILLIDNFSRPIHNNLYTLYGKNISQLDNAIEVDLDFDYLEKDFVNSNYMNTCFENHSIIDEDDYLEIHLSGAFYCLQDKEMTITVSSIYPDEESNGIIENESSTWIINSGNVDHTDIHYKVYRNKNQMATSYGALEQKMDTDTLATIEFLIIVFVLFIGFIFYKFLYNKHFRK